MVRWFADLTNNDVASVGGKSASLGDMIRALKKEKVRVPDGVATTAETHWHFLDANEVKTNISDLMKHFFAESDVLVTPMTDPDWVPMMRRAAGIITETGGRTCHAAIVSREAEVMHQRLSQGSKHSNLSDAILGGIDGCVTTFAVVAGAVAASC